MKNAVIELSLTKSTPHSIIAIIANGPMNMKKQYLVKPMIDDEEIICVSQACKRYNVRRQTIFLSIYKDRLKAKKVKNKWWFTVGAWKDYQKSKYDRSYSMKNGKHIYNIEEGIMSPTMISQQYGVNKQRLYYLIRQGVIPCQRVGCSYVVCKEDVFQNFEKFKSKVPDPMVKYKKKKKGIRLS